MFFRWLQTDGSESSRLACDSADLASLIQTADIEATELMLRFCRSEYSSRRPASEPHTTGHQTMHARSSQDVAIPQLLLVGGETFAYPGKYVLQHEKREGKPAWRHERMPRYLNFHRLGYWLLGTLGDDPQLTDHSAKARSKLIKGGFLESASGWALGFDFRAHSFAETPDSIPRLRWEEWSSGGLDDFGWYPTEQAFISAIQIDPERPLLMLDPQDLRKDEVLRGAPPRLIFWDNCSKTCFQIQPDIHDGHPVWRSVMRSSWQDDDMPYDEEYM